MSIVKVDGKELDVEQFKNDWALALMSQGVIIKLSIGMWGATAKLKSEDLGLRFTDEDGIEFMNKYIDLGRQRLLPPKILKEIKTLDSRARALLKEHSFDTVWGKFVPFTAFDQWEKENEAIRRDFLEAAAKLDSRYDEIIDIIKAEYRKLAKDVWARLYPENTDKPTDSFLESFVGRVIDQIPSQQEIISTFKYDTTYFIIPMPSFIEENVARAREIQRKVEEEDHKSKLERNTKKRIADEYVKRKKELIDGFLESTVASMRKYVAELCENVLKSIGKNPEKNDISKDQRKKIKAMVKKVRLLNFYDDKEITTLLRELEQEVDKGEGDRVKDVITARLKDVVEVGTKQFIPEDFNPIIDYLDV